MSNVEFRVLGSFEVHGAEGIVGIGGPRQRALLARLVAAAGTVVSTDTLIEDLYHGRPPVTALGSIHVYVSNLRRVIEPKRAPRTPPQLLIARRPGYLLTTTDVDALRFSDLVRDAEQRPPAEALPRLEEALRLWRGSPYGEFAGELWAIPESTRLRELRLTAIERRAQALLDLGRPQAVIHELESEAEEHPLRERLWWFLALALYRAGRQADALAALRRARKLVADQLGLDPGPELQALERDILQQAQSLAPPPEPVSALHRPLPSAPSEVPPVHGRDRRHGETPAPPGGGATTDAVREGARGGEARRAEAVPPRGAFREPLIGREQQLAELKGLTALADRKGMVVAAVSGEPGIGKTRLLQAFRDGCEDLGHLVLWGRCHEGEGVPPLWPWLQVLRALAETVPPPEREALGGLLDDEWPSGLPEPALRRRNQVIAHWLVEAARLRPLVIVLDDLHWADSATLELLRDVAMLSEAPPRNCSLILVGAFRDSAHLGAVSPDDAMKVCLGEVLHRLGRYDLVRVRLTGLDATEIRALVAAMGVTVDDATAERLAERTGGNPFFVCEYARLLAQGQGLDHVPHAVVDLIRRRLALLGLEATRVLKIAALMGRTFDPGLVTQVCRAVDLGQAQTYALLDRAAQAELVVSGDGFMTFMHDLVRETLISDTPPLRKALIHREVMTVLSTKPGTDVAVIAHHAVEAGPVAHRETVRWARAAAEQASLYRAYEEAAAWWGRAVTAHGACDGDPAEHVELLLHQVRALLDAGDAVGARQVRMQAVRVADRAGADPGLAARALTALDAPAVWMLRNPYEPVEVRLVEQFEATLRALPEDDTPERALLLGGLAQELHDGTGDPRCLSLSAEAVAMARRIGDPHLLMRALNARWLSLPQVTHLSEVGGIAEEMHLLVARAGTPEFELLAHMMDTHYKLETADLAGADRAAARCDVLLDHLQLPWPRFQHTLWRAARLALDGRFDDADALYDDAERQAERIGMWYVSAVVNSGRLMLCYQRGTMAEAGPLIDLVGGIHSSADHDARVLERCAQGRLDEALQLAAEGWPAPPLDWSWLTTTCLQGAAQAAVGDLPGCRATHERLLPYAGRISLIGPVDHFLSLLASTPDDAGSKRR
ncbi:BTAD domain-containing putative transcriptional regulator [Microbispora triticiradicis]|uniref:BTAD domain-containing putative transcriptional regulator n=1 Tax=Microbispora triticiradicis TaxID=2200763 RepID=UPI001AD74C95|nr:BTAD domain-containing putative transcriptional regulator [Microbispora triticiradicis]MBO4270870.1 AAA family ATPase [Microbispora triticiradicis]